MKIIVNNPRKYLTILTLIFCSQLSPLFASLSTGQTRSGRNMVELTVRDAKIVERALDYILTRAPRPNMPNEMDPSYPPINLGCDEILRVLCVIRNQNQKICDKLEDLQDQISILDMLIEFDNELLCSKIEVVEELIESSTDVLCSKIEVVEELINSSSDVLCSKFEIIEEDLEEIISVTDAIGNVNETAHEFGSCVDKPCIDDSQGSIIRLLKTILWELRGVFPAGTCATCDPIPPDGV